MSNGERPLPLDNNFRFGSGPVHRDSEKQS